MRNITATAMATSAVRVPVPTCWLPATGGATQVQNHGQQAAAALVLGEKSALTTNGQKQILSGEAMKFRGYGFGNRVDVDAPRVRVATGVPPRGRPV